VFRTWATLRRLSVVAVALATAGVLVAALAGGGGAASAGGSAACGSATRATIATADATVTTAIDRNERWGTGVAFDFAQVSGATDLLSAVAADDRAATLTAVSRIVYHPVWHIVRLRALDAAGRILADVGGPYVIAPVPGVLRSDGRVIGSFVMSVQDDTGVTRLESLFVGNPVGIYLGGKLVAERGGDLPTSRPGGSAVSRGGVAYHVVARTYPAFPTGTLTEVMLVAPPAASLTAQTCAAVRAGEFGRVAERLARLTPGLTQNYHGYATSAHIYTGAEFFVRDGARQLASSSGAGPAVIPTSGTVSYLGRHWLVFSFETHPMTRVYVLIAPA
jgi:hypothetical protein